MDSSCLFPTWINHLVTESGLVKSRLGNHSTVAHVAGFRRQGVINKTIEDACRLSVRTWQSPSWRDRGLSKLGRRMLTRILARSRRHNPRGKTASVQTGRMSGSHRDLSF